MATALVTDGYNPPGYALAGYELAGPSDPAGTYGLLGYDLSSYQPAYYDLVLPVPIIEPGPTAQDLLAAIHDHVRTLPIFAELIGGFRTDLARKPGKAPYAVIREESASPSIHPTGYECHRIQLRVATYANDLDVANDIGKRLALAIARKSYQWVGGVSGKPVSPSFTNGREGSGLGGSNDLYGFTARMTVHTVRPTDG